MPAVGYKLIINLFIKTGLVNVYNKSSEDQVRSTLDFVSGGTVCKSVKKRSD